MAGIPRVAKHVLITGATGGIGKAMAKKLAQQGANLYVTGRDEGKLEQLVEWLEPLRRDGDAQTIRTYCFDIGHLTKVKEVMPDICKLPLDTVIFNAGMMFPKAKRDEAVDNLPFLEDTIKVNVLGHFVMAQHLLKDRRREGESEGETLPHLRFVVISSVMAKFASQYLTRWPNDVDSFHLFFSRRLLTSDGWLSYFDSKLAAIVMAESLNGDNEELNTSAVAIHPGVASTELSASIPYRALLRPFSWFTTMESVDTLAERVIGEAVLSNGPFDRQWICDGITSIPTNVDDTQKRAFMDFIESLTN